MQDKTEEFFLHHLRTHYAGSNSPPSGIWIVPHLSLSDAPSLALLLPFLTSGPDLGAWPECWVSMDSSVPPFLGRGRVAPPSRVVYSGLGGEGSVHPRRPRKCGKGENC